MAKKCIFLKLDDAVNVAIKHFNVDEADKEWVRNCFEQKCYLSNTTEYEIGYNDGLQAVKNAIKALEEESYAEWLNRRKIDKYDDLVERIKELKEHVWRDRLDSRELIAELIDRFLNVD